MPLDSILLSALADELRPALLGATVDKVFEPASDEIILTVRGNPRSRQLAVSLSPSFPGIYFTEAKRENPKNPPMFCMLLRKHVQGAKITAVEVPMGERIVTLRLNGLDELGERSDKLLIVELMGRRTNLILAKDDGLMLDCLKRVTPDDPAGRRMLPGLFYEPPKPMESTFFMSEEWSADALRENLKDMSAVTALKKSMGGLSNLAASEICRMANAEPELMSTEPEKLIAATGAFREKLAAGQFAPTMLNDGAEPADVYYSDGFICPPGKTAERFPTFSGMMDAWYVRKASAELMKRLGKDLRKLASNALKREQRKLETRRNELARCDDRDALRQDAELIIGNIYRLKKGETSLTAEDWSVEGAPLRTVKLDPLKTPQQNAAAYFKEYKKAGAAIEHLTGLIETGEKQVWYLESVLDEIDRASTSSELEQIRLELSKEGVIQSRKGQKKGKEPPALPPYKFTSDEGYEILVGRNNVQNETLTFKVARKDDYWLHVKEFHGSHVIVRCSGAEPDEKTMELAASLAAEHSSASGSAAVDIARVKFVKKMPGGKPGMVTYTNYRTVIAKGSL